MLRRLISAPGAALAPLLVALATVAGPARAQEPHSPPAGAGAPAAAEAKAAEAPAPHGAGEAHGPAAAGAHGAGGEKTNPLEVQPSLALWTFVVFIGLLAVLGRYAWKPLLTALHQREEHMEHVLLQAEKARNESEQLLAEQRRLFAQADDRIRAMIDKATHDAQARAEEIVRAAQAEAEASRDRAQREIATARDQALSEIWSQTANLAVSVAGRVLSRDLGADDHRRLIESAIRELPAGPASANGHGGGRS